MYENLPWCYEFSPRLTAEIVATAKFYLWGQKLQCITYILIFRCGAAKSKNSLKECTFSAVILRWEEVWMRGAVGLKVGRVAGLSHNSWKHIPHDHSWCCRYRTLWTKGATWYIRLNSFKIYWISSAFLSRKEQLEALGMRNEVPSVMSTSCCISSRGILQFVINMSCSYCHIRGVFFYFFKL